MNPKKIWPLGQWRMARKPGRCDYIGGKTGLQGCCCTHVIQKGERYFDPGEANPDSAGGFGGYRYCQEHFNETGGRRE